MKKSSVNTFTEGLVCDLDPINVPNNVLTDCLNGTIITYDGNEYSLQNDKGNYPLNDCKLKPDFIPVGIKEYGGILYIVSINPITGEEEIGSYPSIKLNSRGPFIKFIDTQDIINNAFENNTEVDYLDLKSKCRTWYYSDPNLKINVGDKFWFNENLNNTNFEKIERYVIDENSIPHIISDDWINSDGKYVSPISGTVMLKNTIFEISNSIAETNTFTCWSYNDGPDIEVTTIDSLFSFTHKLYIDDIDSINWISPNYLQYEVHLKINNSEIYQGRFSGNVKQSISGSYDQYTFSIESNPILDLEWYSDNKILSKYFISIIKNIDSDDQVSVEIVPILSIEKSKNIILSQCKQSLTNSVSEFTSTTWTIGDEYYRFYNYPINGEYTTQYVELDIKGPVEASGDFTLACDIYDYTNSNKIESYEYKPGIGKAILQIPYGTVQKEARYQVKYSIIVAGTSIKTLETELITSELFNYDEYYDESNYLNIDVGRWASKYWDHCITPKIQISSVAFYKELNRSKYAYVLNRSNSDYLGTNLYSTFILENDPYSAVKQDTYLIGSIYNSNIDIDSGSYLRGPLWNINTEDFKLYDKLGKSHTVSADTEKTTLELPAGIGQNLNITNDGSQVVGRIDSIEAIQTKPMYLALKYISESFTTQGGTGYRHWPEIWWGDVKLQFDSTQVPNGTINPYQQIHPDILDNYLENNTLYQGSVVKEIGKHGNLWINCPLKSSAILCKSLDQNSAFTSLPIGTYYKVNSSKDEKYNKGIWQKFTQGSDVTFKNIDLSGSQSATVTMNYGPSITLNKVWSVSATKELTENYDKTPLTEFLQHADDSRNTYNREYSFITANPGDYVKGIALSKDGNTSYYQPLCTQYRSEDKIRDTSPCNSKINWGVTVYQYDSWGDEVTETSYDVLTYQLKLTDLT